ncbi:hypothetical protein NPIL_508751, partial [Nephila pilipes]
ERKDEDDVPLPRWPFHSGCTGPRSITYVMHQQMLSVLEKVTNW